MHQYSNHLFVILASFFSALGIISYVVESRKILAPVFTALYLVGISFWFSFGIRIESLAVTISSGIQVTVLLFFIFRSLKNES